MNIEKEEVEEYHRILPLCNKKHISSEYNDSVKLDMFNRCVESVCLTCKKCLINYVRDDCVSKYLLRINMIVFQQEQELKQKET